MNCSSSCCWSFLLDVAMRILSSGNCWRRSRVAMMMAEDLPSPVASSSKDLSGL